MSWYGKTVKQDSNKSGVHEIHPNSPLLINNDQRTLVRPSVVQSLDLTLLPCRPSSHLYLKSDMHEMEMLPWMWEVAGSFKVDFLQSVKGAYSVS